MRIRTGIQRKKNMTSELAPSIFDPPGENFEPSISAAPQSAGHSFGNLSVAQPQANLSMNESGDHYEEAEHLADQIQENAGNNLGVQRMFQAGLVQARLSMSSPGDEYEQEAERVAMQVMRMPTPPSVNPGQACDHWPTPEVGEAAPTKPLATTISPLIERAPSHRLGKLDTGAEFEARLGANGGSPLPASTRAFMESRFGSDFGDVRVHTGSEATRLNRSLSAQAFTHGKDIYLGEGSNSLDSVSGQQLLAHELTHTIQQGAVGGNVDRAGFQSAPTSQIVQRQAIPGKPAVAPPAPAPAPAVTPPVPVPPGVTPPAAATADTAAPGGGWTLRGILDGTQKVKFGIGSHTLFSKHPGRRFGWSTEKVPGKGPSVPLALGAIPLPLPVGPIETELSAGVSAYAGGNALIDLKVNDVKLEATAADLARVGAAAFLTVVPVGGPVLPLAMLASLRLRGEGTLSAQAKATVSAGADAFINCLVNPLLWPVGLIARGSLGVDGSITADLPFEGPVQVEFHLGRLRLVAGSYRVSPRFAADLALKAALSILVVVGYRPLTSEHELWRVDGGPSVGIDVKSFVESSEYATLTANDDGIPEVNLEKFLVNGKALIQAMFGKRNPGNDLVRPYPPGQAPEGQPPAALELPASKAHHLARYRGLLGELHHVPGRVRKTNQVGKWVSSLKGEISLPMYERAIDLGLLYQPGDETNPPDHKELFNRARKDDSPVFVPFWSRTRQFATAMGVDHVIEWQVYPTALVDEPWNFELLDPSSNSSAGSGLDANLDRLRSTLPPAWQARILVFTDVVAPVAGRVGETWSHEEILKGAHLDVYESGRFGPKRRRPASP